MTESNTPPAWKVLTADPESGTVEIAQIMYEPSQSFPTEGQILVLAPETPEKES